MAVRLPTLGLDCQSCKGTLRINRGCDRDSPIPGKWGKFGYDRRCPNKVVTRDSFEYLQAYGWLESGHYPDGGCPLDQPAKLIEAFDVISSEIADIQKEESENVKQRT